MHLATEHHQAGRYAQAEQVYRQILAAAPKYAPAIHMLGVQALHAGKVPQAIDLIQQSLAIDPNEAFFHYNLGLALIASEQFEKAADAFRQTIALRPTLAEAHSNLAATLLYLRRFDETLQVCDQARIMNAENPDIYNVRGAALKQTHRYEEATAAYEQALSMRPDHFDAQMNLAAIRRLQGNLPEAIAGYRKAVAMRPSQPLAHYQLANALDDDNQVDAAIDEFEKAIALQPNYADAECSLAATLHRVGRYEQAIAACRRGIAISSDVPLLKFNLALMLLLQGQFEEGWQLHEARWDVDKFKGRQINFLAPRWDGSDLSGKTILLYGEQGYGDTIQFSRYISMIRDRGAKVILGVLPPLVRLFRNFPGVDQVFAEHNPSMKYDFHYPLMSLPLMFKTTLETIPAAVRYISADPLLASQWRKRIPDDPGKPKIGLSWAGRPTHPGDRLRSLPLASLATLADVPNTWFCSLQKGDAADQANLLPNGFEVTNFSQQINDFADAAAIIEHLDLVITVDTATAHLAGAMGKRVWVLLPFVPDWRWMLGRTDSPWYPTMRLFRQTAPGDWAPVIEALRQSLIDLHSRM